VNNRTSFTAKRGTIKPRGGQVHFAYLLYKANVQYRVDPSSLKGVSLTPNWPTAHIHRSIEDRPLGTICAVLHEKASKEQRTSASEKVGEEKQYAFSRAFLARIHMQYTQWIRLGINFLHLVK
jgi:hypothetical protein